MRNKAKLVAVKKMLDMRSARLLPVTEAITLRATELMESLTLSHGVQMGDALIAATALDHGLPVLTANVKHFSAVANLTVEALVARIEQGDAIVAFLASVTTGRGEATGTSRACRTSGKPR